jgi:prophage tail gpP-like protein
MNGFVDTFAGLVPSSLPDPQNAVSIEIGNTSITGWESLSITCSAEAFPRSFSLTASDPYFDDPSRALSFPEGPGKPCTIKIGEDTVITGFLDRYTTTISTGQHIIQLTGRGKGEDLVDCSADLENTPGVEGATMTASSIEDVATKLCSTYGITVKNLAPGKGAILLPFTIWLGETSYEVIERVARYTSFLVYEDELGQLILNQVGTEKMASGFSMGPTGNIEGATATLSYDQRYSSYTVVWNSIAQYNILSPVLNNRAFKEDPAMAPRKRPLIIVSEQNQPDMDLGQARADWEYARRIGRSQAIRLTCDNWRDSAGKLWQPNYLATIDAPALKLENKEWIIGTVTFRKDQSGTHADVVLMPPDAFKPQPAPLFLWDLLLTQSVQSPQGVPLTPPKPGPGGLLGGV